MCIFISESTEIPDYKLDYIAVVSSIVLFFIILFMFAVFENVSWMHEQTLSTGQISFINICVGSQKLVRVVKHFVNHEYDEFFFQFMEWNIAMS